MNSGIASRTALLYEPRVEGHHLVWLKFIVEDFLSANWKLTLALDTRPESVDRIQKRLGALLERVVVLPVWDEAGRIIGGNGVSSVADTLARARTELVFLNTFDEIASPLLRRSAVGRMPPASLFGKMAGIYLRPRFLAQRGFSPNEWLKGRGFARLMREGWFRHLLFLDPWIEKNCRAQFPRTPVSALPDPCPDNFIADPVSARRDFQIPAGRKVFLFYGGAYRRKGLHLAVEAFLSLPRDSTAFLLCAGQQPNEPEVQRGLELLAREGRALVISRYIFEEEEKRLFAAADVVLLPYIKHFGNSAVLSRAAGAGKMVVASDEELVGRLVREHGLGLLFGSGNAAALRDVIAQAERAPADRLAQWQSAAQRYAEKCSRAEFRRVLAAALE